MRTTAYAGVLLLTVFAAIGNAATSADIIFTHAGSGSGTLNGVPFSTSNFVITSFASTSDKILVGSNLYSMDHQSSSIAIAGLGNFDILIGTRTFFDAGGVSRVGFSRAGSGGLDLLLGPQNVAFRSWNMTSPIGPLTGDTFGLEQWNRTPLVDTTGGILIFNDGGGPATFTATMVPEPAALCLLAFGGCLGLQRARFPGVRCRDENVNRTEPAGCT
jgi:hypothetical protein